MTDCNLESKPNTYPNRVSSLSWTDPSCIFWARAVRGSFFCGTEGTVLSLELLTLSSFPSTSPQDFSLLPYGFYYTHMQLILWLQENAKSQKVSSLKTPVLKYFENHILLSLSWNDWPKMYLNYCQRQVNSFNLRFKQLACHLSLRRVSVCVPLLSGGLYYSIKRENLNVNYFCSNTLGKTYLWLC